MSECRGRPERTPSDTSIYSSHNPYHIPSVPNASTRSTLIAPNVSIRITPCPPHLRNIHSTFSTRMSPRPYDNPLSHPHAVYSLLNEVKCRVISNANLTLQVCTYHAGPSLHYPTPIRHGLYVAWVSLGVAQCSQEYSGLMSGYSLNLRSPRMPCDRR